MLVSPRVHLELYTVPPADRLAVAAHLHVAMRRKMGRITDTEWLASNLDYARAMLSLCAEQPDEDVRLWAARLAALWARVQTAAPAPTPAAQRPAAPALPAAGVPPRAVLASRYIGRLR